MKKKITCTILSSFLLLTCLVSVNIYRQFSTKIKVSLPSFEQTSFDLPRLIISKTEMVESNSESLIHDQVMVWLSEKYSYKPTAPKLKTAIARKETVLPKAVVQKPLVEDRIVYGVNGEERFKHYGFNHQVESEIISFLDYFENQKIEKQLLALKDATALKEEVVAVVEEKEPVDTDLIMTMMDDVSTQLASVIEQPARVDELKIENNENPAENDLVLIDYSNELERSQPEVITDEPIQRVDRDINNIVSDLAVNNDIPESVMMAIQRTMEEPLVPTIAMNTQNKSEPQIDTISQAKAATERRGVSSQNMNTQNISRNSIKFYAVDLNQSNKNANVANIEFHSDILPQRITDGGSGTIFIEEKLNGKTGSIRGTFLSGGYVPTKMDIPIEAGSFELSIPLFSSYELNRFLTAENLSAQGGLLLVQLATTTDNVEIDAFFEAKIYLSSNFRVVEPTEEYEFILFSGVTAGNILLQQRNFRGEVAQKIIHITDDELYFEGGQMVAASKDLISLEAINLLGRKNSSLDISSDNIKVFNTSNHSKKMAIGKHEVGYPIQASGMRKYLEMTHLRGSIFVGYSSNNDLKIPSQELVYHIIEAHGLRSLENTCMIQINFKNQVAQIEAFGESNKGPMALIETYLDNDGQWGQEATEMTEHMFIAGDERGAISIKVEYLDGSRDFLQTFCSYDTYLVEQL